MRCPPVPIAAPPKSPRYVMPGSNCLDPPYNQRLVGPPQFVGQWPFPRLPWPFESETRAPGTGLLQSPFGCPPPQQPPRTPRYSAPWFQLRCC